jgi:hypothetical protein
MNPRSEYLAYLGARGWRHPAWERVFYPADLPGDWQLAFYATQFSCVWLDAEQLPQEQPGEHLATWLAETPDSFRFLLEPTGEQAQALASQGEGRVIICGQQEVQRLIWFDRTTDLRVLSEQIRGAHEDPPVYLLSRDNDLGMVERVRTLLELLGL